MTLAVAGAAPTSSRAAPHRLRTWCIRTFGGLGLVLVALAAEYVSEILHGANLADLPMQPPPAMEVVH